MNNTYCVYKHVSPSGKVYVGQSLNYQKRWGYNGEHYLCKKENGEFVQRSFARAIVKYGWDNFNHEIILENISKSEADYAEKYLIRWYKIHNLSYNITDGGEGTCGIRNPLSEERKRQISLQMRTNHPMKGKKHTPEAMAKIIYANTHRVYTEEQRKAMAERARKQKTGSALTEKTRKKLSEYRKAHPETWIGGWNKKEVHQYDFNGNYVASFPSAMEAAIALRGKGSGGKISGCVKGKVSSAFGYIWKDYKVDHIDVVQYKVVFTKHGARLYDMSEEGRMKRRAGHGRRVNQYSLDGKYIATYNSVTDAGEKVGCRSGIGKCCSGKSSKYKTAGGYLWRYDTGDNRCTLTNLSETA